MANKEGFFGTDERHGFYCAAQAAWGTPNTTPASWHFLRENTGALPYDHQPLIEVGGPAGHGKGYPTTDFTGRARHGFAQAYTFPLTQLVLRDALMRLWNNTTVVGTNYIWAAFNEPVKYTKPMNLFVGMTKDDSVIGSGMLAQDAIPTQLDITVPQAEPGGSAGLCELTESLIGSRSARETTHPAFIDVAANIEDTCAFLRGDEVSVHLGTPTFTELPLLETKLTLLNKGLLSPEGSTDGYTPAAWAAGMGATASIKAWAKEETTEEWVEELWTAWDAKTLILVKWEFATAADYISLPMLVTNISQPENILGGQAFNIDLKMFGSSDPAEDTYIPTASMVVIAGASATCGYAQ